MKTAMEDPHKHSPPHFPRVRSWPAPPAQPRGHPRPHQLRRPPPAKTVVEDQHKHLPEPPPQFLHPPLHFPAVESWPAPPPRPLHVRPHRRRRPPAKTAVENQLKHLPEQPPQFLLYLFSSGNLAYRSVHTCPGFAVPPGIAWSIHSRSKSGQ